MTRIGTAERGGTFHTQGLALKTVLERAPALAPVAVLETPGASVENARRLAARAIELGFMAANWVPLAAAGVGPFERSIELRVIAPMNAGPLFFIARADGAIGSIADLAGKRVVFGAPGSGMAQHAQSMLDALGIAVTPIRLDFAAGADALVAGAVDAQLQCPIPNRVMTELAARIAVRVLPYGTGLLERLLHAVPQYRRTTMPAGAINGLARDVAQPAVLNLLVAQPGYGDQEAAAVARAVALNAAALARLNPLFDGLDALFAALPATLGPDLTLHRGALGAYRDIGLLPDREDAT